jgi:hypothetical protein
MLAACFSTVGFIEGVPKVDLTKYRFIDEYSYYALIKLDGPACCRRARPIIVISYSLSRRVIDPGFDYGVYVIRKNTVGFAGLTVKVIWFVVVDPLTTYQLLLRPTLRELVCVSRVQPVWSGQESVSWLPDTLETMFGGVGFTPLPITRVSVLPR